MADLSDFELINISGLPSGTAAGSNLLAQDDGSNVTKITINQAVAASQAMQQVNNKIGSTALPTTAQTLTGAIAEHEADLTALNGKLTWQSVTLTAGSGVTINSQAAYKMGGLLCVFASITLSSNVSAYATLLTHGLNARCGWIAPLYTNYKTPTSQDSGVYGDAGNTTIRASQSITAGTYQISCVIPWH